jgi:two-component system response regulator CpxR
LRILLVDDDAGLCSLVSDVFKQRGLHVEVAHDGRTGLGRALSETFDLIILDLMLPQLDGFQVLDQIRRRSAVPVIILTARGGEHDRIAGLDGGADDYLPKPFGPDELLAHIRAVMRRAGLAQTPSAPIQCGEIRLDPVTREVRRGNMGIVLTSIEFEILLHLMKSAGRIVSRDEITAVLYQRPATPYERALDVHISHLRKKLEAPDRPVIHTVRGVGYVLTPNGTLEMP